MEPRQRDQSNARERLQRPDDNSKSNPPTSIDSTASSPGSQTKLRYDQEYEDKARALAIELARRRSGYRPSNSTTAYAMDKHEPPVLNPSTMTGPELQALMEWLEFHWETPPPTPGAERDPDKRPSKQELRRKAAKSRLRAIAKRIRKLVGKMNDLACSTGEYAQGHVELEHLEIEIAELVPLIEDEFNQAPESSG